MNARQFNATSEWIKAGSIDTGWIEVFPVAGKETAKAVGVQCTKFTACANAYEGVAWLPKSQLHSMRNDFYVHGGAVTMIAPKWLIEAKRREGCEI